MVTSTANATASFTFTGSTYCFLVSSCLYHVDFFFLSFTPSIQASRYITCLRCGLILLLQLYHSILDLSISSTSKTTAILLSMGASRPFNLKSFGTLPGWLTPNTPYRCLLELRTMLWLMALCMSVPSFSQDTLIDYRVVVVLSFMVDILRLMRQMLAPQYPPPTHQLLLLSPSSHHQLLLLKPSSYRQVLLHQILSKLHQLQL